MDNLPCESCGREATVVYYARNGREAWSCGECYSADLNWRDVRRVRKLNLPPVPEPAALTVAEAAARERVSEKTIRRALPALTATGGAWRVGRAWRIDGAALRAARTEPPRKPAARPRRRRKPAADDDLRW